VDTAGFWVETLKNSPNPVYQQLANTTIVPHTYEEMMTIHDYHILGNGTHVFMDIKFDWRLDYKIDGEYVMARYYWSKEVIGAGAPWPVWIVNKKWPLHDELAKHILLYQQVCSLAIAG